MDEQQEPKPINIYQYLIPFIRLAIILISLINLINQLFFGEPPSYSMTYLIGVFFPMVFSFSFFLFYIIEFRKELKGAFVQAIYLRIAIIFMELLAVLFVIYFDYEAVITSNFHIRNIFQMLFINFMGASFLILLIVNLKRTLSLFQ